MLTILEYANRALSCSQFVSVGLDFLHSLLFFDLTLYLFSLFLGLFFFDVGFRSLFFLFFLVIRIGLVLVLRH